LLTPLEWALRAIELVVLAVLLLVAFAADFVAQLIVALLRMLAGDRTSEQQPLDLIACLNEALRQRDEALLPPELLLLIRWISVAILAALVLLVIARSLRLRARGASTVLETRESLASGA